MRKIEEKMLKAIEEKRNFKLSNTEVERCNNYCEVWLHGYRIARIYDDGRKLFRDAGWQTATTKSRLNALGAGIIQRNFIWYDSKTGKEFVNAF